MPNLRKSKEQRLTIVWWVLLACMVGVFLNMLGFPALRFTHPGLNTVFPLLVCTWVLFELAVARKWGRSLGSGLALLFVLAGIWLGGGTFFSLLGRGVSEPIIHNRGPSQVVVYPDWDGVEVLEERTIFPGLKVVRRVAWGYRVGPAAVELVYGDSVQITSSKESPKRYEVGRFPF